MLYLHHAAALSYKNAVVRTPDTDIFVILLYHAHTIKLTVYLDTGSGKQRQLINVSEMTTVPIFLASISSPGRIVPVLSKGKEEVGPLKSLRRIRDSTRCSENLGMTGE